ncbi:IS200/IS605 family transposase [Moheibacter stercoris]|uniref:REP element-mobilizing transposase RayT n=1 Tax=Moheibacter stercoris TaxID=1628251 RepID=A0ABV2LR32_9FLAO
MGDAFHQIYVQLVFAVKGRQSLIKDSWEIELYSYIGGILKEKGNKPLAINGMPDHIHIFYSHNPNLGISELVREIKKSSNIFINSKGFVLGKFEWQQGYGAFSYNKSAVSNVINYIDNQKIHHQKTSFQSEYKSLLEKFEIEYKEEYLFDWMD